MTPTDLPSAPSNLAPTSGLISRALDSLRAFATDTHPSDDLKAAIVGIATFVIHHAVETLRRAGLAKDARRILLGELNDLTIAARDTLTIIAVDPAHAPNSDVAAVASRKHDVIGINSGFAVDTGSRGHVALNDARPRAPAASSLTLIPGGRR